MFLFVKARIATDDEGVLPFPRDLHKISILEASREKYRRVTRAHDESLLLKPALLALTYAEITKEKSLFSRIGPISRLHPAFPPLVSSPRPPSCILDPPASSRYQSHLTSVFAIYSTLFLLARLIRALMCCFFLFHGGLVIDQFPSHSLS